MIKYLALFVLFTGCTPSGKRGEPLKFKGMEFTVSDSAYVDEFDKHVVNVLYTLKNQSNASARSMYQWLALADADGHLFQPVKGRNAAVQPLERLDSGNLYELPRAVDMSKPLYFGWTDPKQSDKLMFRIELHPAKIDRAPAWWF